MKVLASDIGRTVTLNGFGDLGMESVYRKYINDDGGKHPLTIIKLTRGGLVYLRDTQINSTLSVSPKSIDFVKTRR